MLKLYDCLYDKAMATGVLSSGLLPQLPFPEPGEPCGVKTLSQLLCLRRILLVDARAAIHGTNPPGNCCNDGNDPRRLGRPFGGQRGLSSRPLAPTWGRGKALEVNKCIVLHSYMTCALFHVLSIEFNIYGVDTSGTKSITNNPQSLKLSRGYGKDIHCGNPAAGISARPTACKQAGWLMDGQI